jgi:hypothetical protein
MPYGRRSLDSRWIGALREPRHVISVCDTMHPLRENQHRPELRWRGCALPDQRNEVRADARTDHSHEWTEPALDCFSANRQEV